MTGVKFDLKVACKSCPFRREGKEPVRLNTGRVVEIHNTITNWHGGSFSCHKTVDYSKWSEDDFEGYRPTKGEHHCAGALGYLANLDSDGPQGVKFAVYGMKKMTYADFGPPEIVFDSLQEWKESCLDYKEDEPDILPCETANSECIAPAGYLTGGGIAYGTESADDACKECGAPTCSACIRDGLCGYCYEYEQGVG